MDSRKALLVASLAAALALAGGVAAPAPAAAEAKLVPRELLFGNPERTAPTISPDGTRMAWLAPDKAGVLQVWVQTVGKDDARAVTADARRPVRRYEWAEDDRTLLYAQDAGGDENFHVYGVDLESGNVRDLTPWQGVRADIQGVERARPNELLVTMNLRKREVFDVWRIDLKTGAATLDTENPGDVLAWIPDEKLQVRGALASTPDGGWELRVRDGGKGKWRSLVKAGPEETLEPHYFRKDGQLLVNTSLGGDLSRLVAMQVKNGKETLITQHDVVDVGPLAVNPYTLALEAVSFHTGKPEWRVLDKSVAADYEALARLENGFPQVVSRTRKDDVWIVAISRDDGPTHFWRWDRKAKKGEMLFSAQPKLDAYELSPMQPVELKARDGLPLRAYLTLPPGGGKNLPMVLLVHGGPWARDTWGFRPGVQHLANRGYAVLQVNYRGSIGYGKKFLHAGDKQWGLAMHTDLIDAVDWAVQQGIADRKRVAIMGGSYGGYAALAGAAFTPDVFRCAVDVVGPSNLFTLLATIPPYWKPRLQMFYNRIGDPEKEKDLLTKASPLFSAGKIKIPLLIAQGANDPRVKQAESEQIVAAVEKNKGRVIYVLYPDEGHGFARPENNLDFSARAEVFLGEHLGGRVEPMKGDKHPGSTAIVKVVGGKKK
jgi:dipeptidyl aminopeptidase/acylaminoacyl peptidase